MRKLIVDVANRAHRIVNPFGRRALLVLAVFGLVLYETVKWIGILLFLPIYPFICLVIGFFKGLFEVPSYTFHQAKSDLANWSVDCAGIARIWRSAKDPDANRIHRNQPGDDQ